MLQQKILQHTPILIIIGTLFTFTGLLMFVVNPIIFEQVISSELVLTPTNNVHKLWHKQPMPLALDFYFFNWTNPEDVRDTSIKPRLTQMGPYRFGETKEKVDIQWNDNGTVSFRQLRNWYFDRENSVGDLEDEVTTLNAVAVTASTQSKELSYVLQKALSLSMSSLSIKVHITKTVGELLFEGYSDTLIDVARKMPALAGIDLPPFDKFGWFYLRNGSTAFDGLFNMGTGVRDLPLGAMDRWNMQQRTEFFEGECGRVGGSAGEFWPQYATRDSISMFSPDMCREVSFDYLEDDVVNGINGYTYVGSERTMDNGSKYPENKCYCGKECIPSGILDVSKCRYGSPGYVSFPHFYLADPYYRDQFEGLDPRKELHELSITIEPRTGIPLAVAARFQINILMTENSNNGLFNDVPKLYFPMIWFEQKVQIPDHLASNLHTLLNLPCIGTIIAIVVLSIGIVLLAMLLVVHIHRSAQIFLSGTQVKKTYYSREEVPLNDNSVNTQITAKRLHVSL